MERFTAERGIPFVDPLSSLLNVRCLPSNVSSSALSFAQVCSVLECVYTLMQ